MTESFFSINLVADANREWHDIRNQARSRDNNDKKKKKKKEKKFLIPKQTNSEEKVLRKEPIYVAGIKVGEKGYSAIYTIRFEHDHSAIR